MTTSLIIAGLHSAFPHLMYRFQSPKKQFPINHSLFRFLFIFSTKRPLSDNCQSGSFLFCRSISKVYCLRILSIRGGCKAFRLGTWCPCVFQRDVSLQARQLMPKLRFVEMDDRINSKNHSIQISFGYFLYVYLWVIWHVIGVFC
ncbi:uncharacterized protein [Gossypium hirsutum]|uniref:Uncharacterized protein n=1 Tax=Gossypium hirsutum TaxID=3635 RepID=A0A1U8ICN2_GOSHI|nr:uncharacterized protein LOC107895213 [Gossypium hirsutum]